MASDTRLHGKIATVQDAKAHHVARLGGRCSCCGEMAVEFLEVTWADVDPFKSGGFDSPGPFYAYLDKQSDDRAGRFVVRCANCHHAIARHGTCPHRSDAAKRPDSGPAVLLDDAIFVFRRIRHLVIRDIEHGHPNDRNEMTDHLAYIDRLLA